MAILSIANLEMSRLPIQRSIRQHIRKTFLRFRPAFEKSQPWKWKWRWRKPSWMGFRREGGLTDQATGISSGFSFNQDRHQDRVDPFQIRWFRQPWLGNVKTTMTLTPLALKACQLEGGASLDSKVSTCDYQHTSFAMYYWEVLLIKLIWWQGSDSAVQWRRLRWSP